MKKFFNIILVVALILTVSLSIVYASEDEIKVMINGEYVQFDVEPQLINDRTMVPFRAIFEAMGAKVEWNQDLWQAVGEKDGKKVSMIIGSNEVVVNENGQERIIQIDQAPIIVDGRTLVPVRFVAEAFDKIVSWDDWERTVIILDLQGFANEMKEKAPNFYEYVSTLNTIPNNFKQTDEFEFSMKEKDNEYKQEGEATFIGEIESIVNENDAYLGLDMEVNLFITGGITDKQKKDITASAYIQDNNLLISTNLFKMTGEDEIEINGKSYSVKNNGILFDIEKFGIPGVSNFKELKEFINLMLTDFDEASNYINNAITSEYIDIDVDYVSEIVDIYDIILALMSNENFVKKEMSNQTVYALTINKETIVDVVKDWDFVVHFDSLTIAYDTLNFLQEITSIAEDVDVAINFYVKDDITKKITLDFNVNVEQDDLEGTIKLEWEKDISNVNNGEIKINHPDYTKGTELDTISYEYIKQQLPIIFETYQEEATNQINENIQNGKDKFDGITQYTEATFPTEGYILNGNILVSYCGSGNWGIDKNGVIYYAPGYYFEDDNITIYNNNYSVEGKGEYSLDVKELIKEEYTYSFFNVLEGFYEAFEEFMN